MTMLRRIINKITGSSQTSNSLNYHRDEETKPLRHEAEVYIEVDVEKNVPEDKIRESMSRIGALRNLSLEKPWSFANSYVATFSIETIRNGKRLKETIKSMDGIRYCGIRAFYTPQGNGSEG